MRYISNNIDDNYVSGIIAVITFMIISLQFPCPAHSYNQKDTCYQEAVEWIKDIDVDKKGVLEKQALSRCESARKWISQSENNHSGRERLCTDLVLIWTHKKCIYFRDYITYKAYEPCKSWSREMYKRCMAKEDLWFNNN